MTMFVSSSRKIIRDYSDELTSTYLHLTNVTTENGTKTSTFTWVIDNVFALVRGVNYNSHFIRFGDTVHRLRITAQTPKSASDHQDRRRTYLLVGLTPSLGESAHVSFTLLGGERGDVELRPEFNSLKTGWQMPNRRCYVEFAEVSTHPYIPLTVLCKMVTTESAELGIEKRNSLLPDLLSLMSDSEHSDMTVEVEGRVFNVHRAVLSVRSPVFRAMFRNQMTERIENRIVIEDSDSGSVEGLIRYMYTGQVVPLTTDVATGLAFLADRYNVQDLLWEVVEFLQLNVGIENVVDLLFMADAINLIHLKEQAVAFIGKHLREVMQSADWAHLRSRGDLLEDILKFFTRM